LSLGRRYAASEPPTSTRRNLFMRRSENGRYTESRERWKAVIGHTRTTGKEIEK